MQPISSATPKIITPIRPGPAPNFESSTADSLAIGNYLVCDECGLSAAECCAPGSEKLRRRAKGVLRKTSRLVLIVRRLLWCSAHTVLSLC
jgi:hypothetical protein